MPQSKVNIVQPFGKPGQLYDGYQQPSCLAYVMAANATVPATPVQPAMGLAFTVVGVDDYETIPPNPSQVRAMPGGTGPFAGILVYGNQYVNVTDFESTQVVPVGTEGDLCTHGHIVVAVDGAVKVGQAAEMSQANGSIKAINKGTAADEGYTLIPNSTFIRVNDGNTEGETAVLEIV